MTMETLGRNYPGTIEPIRPGDKVLVDGDEANVIEVFEPNTKDAADYDCEDTGGVLFDLYGAMLIPFGFDCTIRKRTG